MTFKPAAWPRKLRSQTWFGGTSKDNIYHRGWMKNQGFPPDLFDGRPVIGILNTWSELTPCNAHLNDLAQRVKALLAQRLPETRVLLTRDSDVFVSLEQRAAMANVVGADAFVSIHLNASPTEAERGGGRGPGHRHRGEAGRAGAGCAHAHHPAERRSAGCARGSPYGPKRTPSPLACLLACPRLLLMLECGGLFIVCIFSIVHHRCD